MFIPIWLSDLKFAFSRKEDGQMSFKRADIAVVRDNRELFLQSKGLDINTVVAGELIHSGNIAIATSSDAGRGSISRDWIPGIDGLVTDDPNILLLTTHADCVPLIVYDPFRRILGQIHAGWRGLAAGIVKKLINAFRNINPINTTGLKAWIGPCIHACCYQVGSETADCFPNECLIKAGNTLHLDLVRFIRIELEKLGLNPSNISDSGICTSSIPEFSSYRRDGDRFHAMMCVTGLR